MADRTRTTFKVTVAGRRVVDFSTLRKGDKFILQDDDHPLAVEKGNVCNVATSDAYLRDGIWTIDCEEIEGSGKRIKRGSHPDDWNKPFTFKSSPKVTTEDLLNDDPIFPFTTRPSEVAEEITVCFQTARTVRDIARAAESWRARGGRIGEPDCPPIADDLPRVVATVQTAAAVLSAAGGEE